MSNYGTTDHQLIIDWTLAKGTRYTLVDVALVIPTRPHNVARARKRLGWPMRQRSTLGEALILVAMMRTTMHTKRTGRELEVLNEIRTHIDHEHTPLPEMVSYTMLGNQSQWWHDNRMLHEADERAMPCVVVHVPTLTLMLANHVAPSRKAQHAKTR